MDQRDKVPLQGTASFVRKSLPIHIALMGGAGHGKTLLASAIIGLQNENAVTQKRPPNDQNIFYWLRYRFSLLNFEKVTHPYLLMDFPTQADFVKCVLTNNPHISAAILVVSATEGPTELTEQCLYFASKVNLQNLFVFINKCDMVSNKAQEAQVTFKMRAMLEKHGFPANEDTIVLGSAQKALEQVGNREINDDEPSTKAVVDLLDSVDHKLATVQQDMKKEPFLMPVSSVSSSGSDTIAVSGIVERGLVRIGEEVEIVGLTRGPEIAKCLNIRAFRDTYLDYAEQGDVVRLDLQGTKKSSVEYGAVCCKPNSIEPHKKFEAFFYFASINEAKSRFFSPNFKPEICIRTYERAGTISEMSDLPEYMPSEILKLLITLEVPAALEVNLRFTFREGMRFLGAGCITKIID